MYAVIAHYITTEPRIIFKSFNKDVAKQFYTNAKNGMAAIYNERQLKELKFASIEAKTEKNSFFKETELLHGEQKDKLSLNGHRINEIIETHVIGEP